MRQSSLFTKTAKQAPRDETSVNAKLLEQGGFITKLMAGVYCYLPLGYRVLQNIEKIIREEMNALGAQEVFLPALQPKELWEKTNRWNGLKDVMYQFQDHSKREIGLAVTHEEVVADLVRRFVSSYKDLPVAIFQIQTKFRHELRPKSGLTRGREFSMKDLYSGHVSQQDCDEYYEKVKDAYQRTFRRLGLDSHVVEASGGDFSKEYSHEFQVFTDAGEDLVFSCAKCGFAQNKEIAKAQEGDQCPSCKHGTIETHRAIEVGNIFKLGTKYSQGIGAFFTDDQGKKQPVVMASYGIGPSRVMGTIVEVSHDEHGMIWPAAVAPFFVHLLSLGKSPESKKRAETFLLSLERKGIETLYDDRDVSPAEKLKDADLIGIPHRVVISDRTKEDCEYRQRSGSKPELMTEEALFALLLAR